MTDRDASFGSGMKRSVRTDGGETGARSVDATERSDCSNCGADPDYIKEREGGPDGIWGSHVCVSCGVELYEEADG